MRLLTSFLILVVFGVAAQQAEPILFVEKAFDFGEINEDGGKADHNFQFTNNTGRTIKILSVHASCGCTTPDWTKEPIPPGKTGFVKASYDPNGRPGYFNKSLTVTTDFDGSPISLQIKGQVAGKKKSVLGTEFPSRSGGLRLKFSSFNLGTIFINKAPFVKEFQVYNASDKTINFLGANVAPAYIIVETPKLLAPQQTGTITLSYNAKLRNQFGFMSDNIEIGTDDDLQPVKSFSVYATIEEFFSPQSSKELASAPVLKFDLTAIDLGKVRPNSTIEREVAISNTGKKELQIRSVQGNCTCVGASINPMKIKPGAEGKLTIALSTLGRIGLQQKAVTIYSNDPRNPVQRITLTAYVESQ